MRAQVQHFDGHLNFQEVDQLFHRALRYELAQLVQGVRVLLGEPNSLRAGRLIYERQHEDWRYLADLLRYLRARSRANPLSISEVVATE